MLCTHVSVWVWASIYMSMGKYISRVSDHNGASLLSVLLRKTNLKLWSFGVCSLLFQ